MKLPTLSLITLATAAVASVPAVMALGRDREPQQTAAPAQPDNAQATDSLRYTRLSETDYAEVAEELGISTACIKAVVEIETGNKGEGFGPDSLPLINFDLTMFRKYLRLRGKNPADYHMTHPEVFARLDIKRYGSRQAAQYARLRGAIEIDTVAALEGTFWGMFQIGGFNWKLCGCASVQQFVDRMGYSEREQLELFAAFIRARKLDRFLIRNDWAAFALRYNGPGFRNMRYDTRLEAAYRKFQFQKTKEPTP